MAAPNLADLFGDSDDEDDFQPSTRPRSRPASPAENGAGPSTTQAAGNLSDDDDDFRDVPAPRQPPQLREYSDNDEDVVVQENLQERPQGPPQELKGALLPLPPINRLRLLQTSKFLAVQTLPMTPENLKLERDSASIDEETNEVNYSYRKQMTIRWRERKLPSGETTIESNARFVKWSNGTTQLLLGDEVLDIAELDNMAANQFLFVRHTNPVAFIQVRYDSAFHQKMGQGQLIKKLHLRPGLSSKFHKQLTADTARKHVKTNKVKATVTVVDPNKLKAEKERAEEERIRSREVLQRRQEREMKKYPTVSRSTREYRPMGITPQFLESVGEEPDYSDDEDLTATERARSALQRKRHIEEEEELEAERRLARAKQEVPTFRQHASEEHEEPKQRPSRGILESDDDDGVEIGARHVKKVRRGLVLSDDEDE